MARRIDKFEQANRKLLAGCGLIISNILSRLGAFLGAAERETWRATLDGLSIYGMAHSGFVIALDHHQAISLDLKTNILANMRNHLEPVTKITYLLLQERGTNEKADIAHIQAKIEKSRDP